MTTRRRKLGQWLMGFGLLLTLAAVAADVPIFSDDFSTTALLAEKWSSGAPKAWEIKDGVIQALGTKGSRAISANVEHAGPVAVRLRVKAPSFTPGQWCGVNVRGIYFTLRPDCFWYVYRIDGAERSLGNNQSFDPPKPNTWYEFEIINRDQLWQWKVDGKLIAEFRESNTIVGGGKLLTLCTSGSPIACDNVQVVALSSKADASPNLLRNASFEEPPADHIPTGWIPWSTPSIPPEVFWRDWRVTDEDAYEGKHSLRMERHNGSTADLYASGTGIAVGQPCTFSVYMRASVPDTKVRMTVWEWWSKRHNKDVVIGPEWKRYSVTAMSPAKNMVRGGLAVLTDAVVYVDAAQLEMGTPEELELGEIPSPWRASDLDETVTGDPYAELPIPPPRTLAVADQAPVLDGKLDDACWNDAAKLWPLTLPKGKTPKLATDAYAVFHGDTLYVGMRCHDDDIAKLKADPIDRDSGKLFGQDNIEMFLDPELDRDDYYQLSVSAGGGQFDAGPGRNRGWDGPWQVKTFVGDTYWSMEAALPLTMLNLTTLVNRHWGINLCRTQPRLGEITSTAVPVSPNFHVPDRYPELVWPKSVDFSRYLMLPAELAVIVDSPQARRLTGKLQNRTGQDMTVTLAGQFAEGLAFKAEALTIAAGADAPFSIDLPQAPEAHGGEAKLSATIELTGNEPRLLRSFQATVPVQPVLDCLLERSVYATETEAALLGTIRLPAEAMAGAKLTVEPGRGELTEVTPTFRLAFPISDLKPGDQPLTVTLTGADGKALASSQVTLRKLAPSQPAVALDRARRCLTVNGEPFLAIGPLYGVHPGAKPEAIDLRLNHAADSGFRTVMIVAKALVPGMEAAWDRVFDTAEARGLKIVAWPGYFPKQPLEPMAEFIARYRTRPSLLAWMPVDEPELYTTAEPTIEALAFFAKHDPYHPSYMNNSVMAVPSRFAGLPGDILSIDDYLTNRPNRKVIEMVRDVEAINVVAVPTHRPTWMFLSGNNLQNHSREPTAGEQVAQTYGSVIAGSSGLFYFLGDIRSPKHWEALKRTNEELMYLGPAILSTEPAPAVASANRPIQFVVRRVGSQIYLVCVNVEDAPVDARFQIDVPAGSLDAVVLFEDRLVTVKDGELDDSFAPHERHVYRFNLAE